MSLFATEADPSTATENSLYSWSTVDAAQTSIEQQLASLFSLPWDNYTADSLPGSVNGTETSIFAEQDVTVTSSTPYFSSLPPSELQLDSSYPTTSAWLFTTPPALLHSTVATDPDSTSDSSTFTTNSSYFFGAAVEVTTEAASFLDPLAGDGKDGASDWWDVAAMCFKGFIFCTIIIGAVLGNALVIISVRRNRKLR